jgi:hypothetical protein
VHRRHTEDGNDGVTDEFLDDSVVGTDQGLDAREVRALQRVQCLGVELLSKLGGPDKVTEQNGDQLALGDDGHDSG